MQASLEEGDFPQEEALPSVLIRKEVSASERKAKVERMNLKRNQSIITHESEEGKKME